MWNFLPGGLLMPAAVPMNLADPKFTHDGKFDLQVRGRVASHLENFIRDYMEPGTYSDIEYTPQMDYNVRFYTTRNDYAWAMGKAIAAIDYEKFKPTAEDKDPKTGKPLYADGKEYHSVLNTIWGSVTRLGRPGGTWGAYSITNPNGYKPGRSPYAAPGYTYKGASTTPSMAQTYKQGESGWGKVDDVEYATDDLEPSGTVSRGFDFDNWYDANAESLRDIEPDYDPNEERQVIRPEDRAAVRDALLEELSTFEVPIEDWKNYVTAAEWEILKPDYDKFLAEVNAQKRRARKNRRRARKNAIRRQNDL